MRNLDLHRAIFFMVVVIIFQHYFLPIDFMECFQRGASVKSFSELKTLLNTTSYFDFFFMLLIMVMFTHVIFTINPTKALLNLICGFVLVVFFLLKNQIAYFPIVLLIVYVGAIAILFLFIIMLIDLTIPARYAPEK